MSDEPPVKQVEPPAPRSSKAVLGLLVLNLGVTGFIAFKVLTAHPAEAAAPAHPHPGALTTEITGPVALLEPFVVNLDEPGTSRYLKVTLVVELLPGAELTLEKGKQMVRDVILSHLSGLHVKDTLGAEAKDKIREDLMGKIVKVLGPDKVRRLFFQDFVMQ